MNIILLIIIGMMECVTIGNYGTGFPYYDNVMTDVDDEVRIIGQSPAYVELYPQCAKDRYSAGTSTNKMNNGNVYVSSNGFIYFQRTDEYSTSTTSSRTISSLYSNMYSGFAGFAEDLRSTVYYRMTTDSSQINDFKAMMNGYSPYSFYPTYAFVATFISKPFSSPYPGTIIFQIVVLMESGSYYNYGKSVIIANYQSNNISLSLGAEAGLLAAQCPPRYLIKSGGSYSHTTLPSYSNVYVAGRYVYGVNQVERNEGSYSLTTCGESICSAKDLCTNCVSSDYYSPSYDYFNILSYVYIGGGVIGGIVLFVCCIAICMGICFCLCCCAAAGKKKKPVRGSTTVISTVSSQQMIQNPQPIMMQAQPVMMQAQPMMMMQNQPVVSNINHQQPQQQMQYNKLDIPMDMMPVDFSQQSSQMNFNANSPPPSNPYFALHMETDVTDVPKGEDGFNI